MAMLSFTKVTLLDRIIYIFDSNISIYIIYRQSKSISVSQVIPLSFINLKINQKYFDECYDIRFNNILKSQLLQMMLHLFLCKLHRRFIKWSWIISITNTLIYSLRELTLARQFLINQDHMKAQIHLTKQSHNTTCKWFLQLGVHPLTRSFT